MDGLECSEILYSRAKANKDFRIDSQFYTMKIKRNTELEYCPIGKYLISTQYGVSKDMNADGYGYPIYRSLWSFRHRWGRGIPRSRPG